MGFFDRLFGSSSSTPPEQADDPLGDLSLENLREGYLVDYDLKTWTVETHARYDYEGFPADEWTLRADGETMFLEYEEDDEAVFLLSRPADLTDLSAEGADGPIRRLLEERGEPPATLTFEGSTYELEETGPATRIVGDRRQSLRYWVYEGADDHFVAIERFGESDWNVYAGREVEPFEFDNILPSSKK